MVFSGCWVCFEASFSITNFPGLLLMGFIALTGTLGLITDLNSEMDTHDAEPLPEGMTREQFQELQAPTTFAQLQKYQEELYALQANKPDEYQRLFGNLNPDDPIALEKLRTYYDRLKVQSLAIKAAYVKAQEAAAARGTPEDRKTK